MGRVARGASGAAFGVDLPDFFLVGAGELFADVGVLPDPVVVVAEDVGAVALVALLARAGEAYVVEDEGGVGVVVVVLVLEDVGLFVLPVFEHADG